MKKFNLKKFPVLNLITGPMFSGKTDFLIKKIRWHLHRREKVIIFKPRVIDFMQVTDFSVSQSILQFENKMNNTFTKKNIVSHSNAKLPAISVNSSNEIWNILKQKNKKDQFQIVAIDEAHFFNLSLISVVEKLLEKKYVIWICGLNKGFCDNNLELMNQLLSMADQIFKFNAVCDICHQNPATKTQAVDQKGNPISPDKIQELVGGKEKYQPRCRLCYKKFFR